ncbi:little elongation complex subunit 1 [Silurus meridionalis]|uniref:little elongation complex subunit 1 n=1 Tax=Silurus meridionalis TaxID=175797 RepID=UPI001EEB73A7|nr:little elongation complex subunit 1 [Silurus meridionalis]
MMPGESQSGPGGVAVEASSGTCQNCTVLNQSLDEYVAALLTLKQKIIDTDLLLSEYKEKCDELQKSQRESAKLHQELDEVLLKLGPLEKQTAEYEAARAELQETTAALKVYQVKCEEADGLREENLKAVALKEKLEEALKKAEEAANAQNLESTKLRSEKTTLESELQKTQESLRSSRKAVEELEDLRLQNAKTLILKSNLENQLLALEDTNLKQNLTIQDLRSKNHSLETNIRVTEEKLTTLENELNKETRCSSTQTENEPNVDKAKVWSLLQEVWHCVSPLSKTPENLHFNHDPASTSRPSGSPPRPLPVSPFGKSMSKSTPKRNKASPRKSNSESSVVGVKSPSEDQKKRKIGRKKKRSSESEDVDQSHAKSDEVSDLSLNIDAPVERILKEVKTSDIWDLLGLSSPLPALLSPLPPDELAEMEVESSLKVSSVSKAAAADDDDDEKSQFSKLKPLEDQVSSVDLKASSVAPDTDNKSLQNVFSESQEKINGTSEDSSTTAKASPQKEPDVERLNRIQDSQPSPIEESTPLCNADQEEPQANCDDEIRHGLELGQQVLIPQEGAEQEDKSVQIQTPPSPHTCSRTEPERTLKKIQAEDQNRFGGYDDESSRAKVNGMTSGDSSDDEEFSGLKRKVRGICSRPASNMFQVQSHEKQESTDHQAQGTNCETEAENFHTENKNEDDGHLKLGSITVSVSEPVNLEDGAEGDGEHDTGPAKEGEDESENLANCSIFNADNQQDECVPSSSPNIENMAGGLKQDDAKPKEPSDKSQDNCPATSVNLDVASKNALASIQSPVLLGKVLTEMGPPLRPVVLPLTATPPKCRKHLTSNRPSIQLPSWSSTEGPFSLKQQSKVLSPDPGLQDEAKATLTTPSPSNGVPSSPLQFGSATPKHALPVPGRLPSSALNSSSPSASQENSMQMLDTMYPDLSAQARTLNILRGNVTLGRAASESGTSPPSVNPISGNKTINSSSTAFTKTEQKPKRTGANVLLPKSAKRLRLDTCSPDPAGLAPPAPRANHNEPSDAPEPSQTNGTTDQANDPQSLISGAFEKLQHAYFDVLPVIRSHVFLGRISQVPVLRDEEKAVISEFCSNQSLAEEFLLAILSKIKTEKDLGRNEILQSHCRVYTGLCRWRGDWQKAHALVYTLLKEDFPEAPKLILFMVTTWPTLLSHASPLCRAINVVIGLKAEGEVLDYLSKYLHWDERPPGDPHDTISTLLTSLLEDDTLIFQKHARHGDDLCPAAWEYIFSLELLCAHLGWKWTHDNIIGKRLWPVMNAWVTQARPQQTPVRDVCVAAVLRLIGRLGQLGLKEKLRTSVQNVAKAINLFGKHGISEGVPREVQLSAVYTIYDLAPSNPKEALEALASWRGQITETVPSAVTSCITQIGSVCRQIKRIKE